MNNDVLSALRAEVAALGRRHPNEPYPPGVRERATEAAAELRVRGASWRAISEALGISADALRRWVIGGRRAAAMDTALVPVRVARAPESVASGLVVTSPAGYRIDGMQLSEVVALLGALG